MQNTRRNTRFDWVTARCFCRGHEPLEMLWRHAAEDVEKANSLLAAEESLFSVEPAPRRGESGPPPHDTFTVRRHRPGSTDEVVFVRRSAIIQASGFGHRTPLTAVFALDHDDGHVKALISYEDGDGDDLTCCSVAPWQLLARALGPLFFARSAG